MKRFIAIILCIFAFVGFSGNEKQELRVVPLSNVQWQSIQNQVSTNGYCHIKEQNVVLVITNGCPNIEYLLPVYQNVDNDLERNKLKLKGKRGDKPHYKESMPYAGQSIW